MRPAPQQEWRAPIVAIMLFQVAALFVRAYLETRWIASGSAARIAEDLSYLVVPPILFVFLWPILVKNRSALLSLFRSSSLTLRLAVTSILLGIALRLSFWGGLIALASFRVLVNLDPNATIGPVISFGCPDWPELALSLAVTALLIPLVEETINRGLILQTLLMRGRLLAIFLSSALFAVMHDPEGMTVAFFGGVFLSIQMLNCKSLYGPILAHATYNALVVFDWHCVSATWNPAEITNTQIGIGLLATALFGLSIAFSICIVSQRQRQRA